MEEKVLVHISISPENRYIIFCSSTACDNLSAENVLDVLQVSQAFDEIELAQKSWDLIDKNAKSRRRNR